MGCAGVNLPHALPTAQETARRIAVVRDGGIGRVFLGIAVVAADETERGNRALLNLGHTFGHAIEKARGFDGRVLHGEAVATGMCMAYRFSQVLDLCPGQDVVRVERLISNAGLAPTLSALETGEFDPAELLEHMFQDKKVESGAMTLILTRGIGKSFVQKGVEVEPLRRFLEVETTL